MLKPAEDIEDEQTDVGTNNIIPKAPCFKAQRFFLTVKVQRKMRYFFFSISETQRNFRNKLFDSVKAQSTFAISEWHFRTKLKRNLTSVIEISQHNANIVFFAILDRKRVNNLLKKMTFIVSRSKWNKIKFNV